MEISKLDASIHQLNVAIRCFIEGDYLSSLTLAGAAEDILAGLCRRNGLTTAADSIADYHENEADPKLSVQERRKIIFTVLNKGRNQAKHANKDGEETVNVSQIYPLQMIMRAIPMVRALGGAPSPEIKAMYTWIEEHPEAFA